MPPSLFSQILDGRGCHSCGAQSETFYALHFHVLPERLKRVQHRNKERLAVYCRPCYEAAPDLNIQVGERVYPVPTVPKQDVPSGCLVCGTPFTGTAKRYGMIDSSLFMAGSFTESFCLALLCSECVERYSVELPGRLGSEAGGTGP